MRTQFGTALLKALDKTTTSQKEFSGKVDISPARLSKIINGDLADVKARPTPELMSAIYTEIRKQNEDVAMGLLTAYLADMVRRAEIAGAAIPTLCGVCRNFRVDPDDPTKGSCAMQHYPNMGQGDCNCFALNTP